MSRTMGSYNALLFLLFDELIKLAQVFVTSVHSLRLLTSEYCNRTKYRTG